MVLKGKTFCLFGIGRAERLGFTAGMKAVFLDRDGVLNKPLVRQGKPYSPRSIRELEILDDAPAACAQLAKANFLLICVTNQPDVARGAVGSQLMDEMNDLVRTCLRLDAVLVCPHDDADRCICRKPKPGLLLAAAKAFDVDMSKSFMVGDRWRDIQAGRSAGCATVWIDRKYSECAPTVPDFTADSLQAAANWICSRSIEE